MREMEPNMKKLDLSEGYSDGERKLFALLSRKNGDKISTTDLVKLRYRGRKGGPPQFAREAVVDALKNLGKKLDRNREPVKLLNTPRAGPTPMQFWLEKK